MEIVLNWFDQELKKISNHPHFSFSLILSHFFSPIFSSCWQTLVLSLSLSYSLVLLWWKCSVPYIRPDLRRSRCHSVWWISHVTAISVWKFIFVKTAQPLLTSFTPPKARRRRCAFVVVKTGPAPSSYSLCQKEWRRPVLTTLWLLGGFVCTGASYLSAVAYWVVHSYDYVTYSAQEHGNLSS